jgi:hypothetical protein
LSDLKKQLAAFGEVLDERYGDVEAELELTDQVEPTPRLTRGWRPSALLVASGAVAGSRPLSLLVGFGAVVAAFAVVFVLLPGGSGPANVPPAHVALVEEYVEARNSGDVDLALSLMSEDVDYEEEWPRQTIEGMLGWQHAIGQTLSVDCAADSERATGVICHGTFTTTLDRALGFDDCAQLLLVEVEEGKITSLVDGGTCDEDWDDPFRTWIRENHPDDEALMYDLDDLTRFQMFLNPESIALWDEHVTQFATETSG